MLFLFVLVQFVGFLCMGGIIGSYINWCQNEILEITCVLVNVGPVQAFWQKCKQQFDLCMQDIPC